jgi:uncharacterized protein YbaA (DUF1428 family)
MTKKFGYVDGFIVPIPRKNVNAYKKLAKISAKVWKDHGALSYVECIANDVKKGKFTSFPRSVKLKKGEVVWFSWITYKSRAHRDVVLKKCMKDPRLSFWESESLPFDGMRMIWGGFKPEIKT